MVTRNPTPRYVIVAAFDHSTEAPRVALTAASIATATPGAEIHLVHVVAAAKKGELQKHEKHLEDIARLARSTFRGPIVGHMSAGTAWRAIVQTAANMDADLVIVGTHGREGLARVTMGSVAEKVVQHARCPVLLVREKDHLANREPQIEPPCPDCIETQRKSNGKSLFCAQHSKHQERGHTFYEYPEPFAVGSSIIRAD
jgi:nucleotide-binding universal stress UspA family protein